MPLARLNRRAASILGCSCNYALPSTSVHHVHALAKSDKLPATYDPKFVERGWREHWRVQQENEAVTGHDGVLKVLASMMVNLCRAVQHCAATAECHRSSTSWTRTHTRRRGRDD